MLFEYLSLFCLIPAIDDSILNLIQTSRLICFLIKLLQLIHDKYNIIENSIRLRALWLGVKIKNISVKYWPFR